jgi:hypothetical protein
VLKGVYDMKSKIESFLVVKGKPSLQLCDRKWICHFAFCIDVTQHLN